MDAQEIDEAFKKISRALNESAEDSKLMTARLKEVESILIAEQAVSEQASQALVSLRFIRYFRLRRERRKLFLQALALIKVPKELSDRSLARLSSARDFEDRAKKISQ